MACLTMVRIRAFGIIPNLSSTVAAGCSGIKVVMRLSSREMHELKCHRALNDS
jgi:hypothetical protein